MDERLRLILSSERRIELLRGRVQVGGTGGTTRLVLKQLLAQASPEDLREFGGEGWGGAAQLALEQKPVQAAFDHRRHYGLLQRLSLPLFDLLKGSALTTFSRDIAVRLGESALTPDVFVGYDAAMREYYLEGPPLLAVEIVDPYNLREELERLSIYAANRTPEVWWLEPGRGCARQFVLKEDGYTLRTQTAGWLRSIVVPGLELHLDNAWEPGWGPSLKVAYQGKLSRLSEPPAAPAPASSQPPSEGGLTEELRESLLSGVLNVLAELKNEPDRGGFKADLPFAPTVALTPQLVSFEAFLSWAPEAKFEVLDGELVIGSQRGNRELLGLLLMSCGLVEAFALLPDELKGLLRGAN